MATRVPTLLSIVVIGDDPYVLAEFSTILARRRAYLPVIDGPRVDRPDVEAEVVRRTNTVARLLPRQVVLAALPESTSDLLMERLPRDAVVNVSTSDQLLASVRNIRRPTSFLQWGRRNVGLGVLRALRNKRQIVFGDFPSPWDGVGLDADHLVVCEEGDDHAQVLAANYAYSIDAGLTLIPKFDDDDAEALLDILYGLQERRDISPTAGLERIVARLRAHAGQLPIRNGTAVTFFTNSLPWGIAYQQVPTTHLFNYPDLGIALVNGIQAEQADSPGIRTAVIVDPGAVLSNEIETARTTLTNTGVFTKALRRKNATVHQVANTIRLYPYDLLLISTHCGDVTGERCTYDFVDSSGRSHRLVADIGVAFELPPDSDDVKVTQFIRFVSIDGVEWSDQPGKDALKLGTAIKDFFEQDKKDLLEPVHRESVERVTGSMALSLANKQNYIPLPEEIASRQRPIVINNACGSWHRLAGNYMFGGARAYVGALFSVVDPEAQEIGSRLFGKYYGRELAVALWRAQNDVYGDSIRRPYALAGCHFQQLRTNRPDGLSFAIRELQTAIVDWERHLQAVPMTPSSKKSVVEYIAFLKSELKTLARFRTSLGQPKRPKLLDS